MRASAVTAAACAALVCAGLVAAAPAFHKTEALGLSAWLTPRGSTSSIGSFTSKLTVVRGESQAKLAWKVAMRANRRALAVTVHRGPPGALGPALVTLCEACHRVTRGTVIFFTAEPWFRTGRTMASVPTLSVRVATGPPTGVIVAKLNRGGWHASVS